MMFLFGEKSKIFGSDLPHTIIDVVVVVIVGYCPLPAKLLLKSCDYALHAVYVRTSEQAAEHKSKQL